MDDQPLFERPIDDLVPAAGPRPEPHLPAETVPLDRPAGEVLAVGRRQRWLIAFVGLRLVVFAAGFLAARWVARRVAEAPAPVVPLLMIFGPVLLSDVLGLVLMTRLAAAVFGPAGAVAVPAFMIGSAALGAVGVVVAEGSGPAALGLVVGGYALGLGTLLRLNARATGVLRLNGVRVGLFGARREDLDRLGPAAAGAGRMPRLGW